MRFHPILGREDLLGESRDIALNFFLNLITLDGCGWLTPRPGRLYPGKDSVPIVQEAGWASEPFWIGAKNLAPTGIRSPDLLARSESLYRLRHPGCTEICNIHKYVTHKTIQRIKNAVSVNIYLFVLDDTEMK